MFSKKDFLSELKDEARTIRGAILIQGIFVLISGVNVWYLKSTPLSWVILVSFFGVLAGLSLIGSYLWTRYSTQPEVEEKEKLKKEQAKLSERIALTAQQIEKLEEARGVLESNEQAYLAKRNTQAQEQLAEINEMRRQLDSTYRETQQTALRQLQTTYIREGLSAEKLTEATLPELFDPQHRAQVLARLTPHQILSAQDIRAEWLAQTDLEPETINALLAWRQEIEAELQTTQPVTLPETELEALVQEHQAQIAQLEQQEIVNKVALEKDLFDIREATTKLRERNKNSLSAARSALRGLQDKQNAIAKQREAYAQINFRQFFILALSAALGSRKSRYQVRAGVAHVLVWSFLLLQGGFSLQSVQIINENVSPPLSTAPTSTTAPFSPLACLPTETLRQIGIVSRVVDGDTIDVEINGEKFRVRYIGIDAPEPDQDYGGLSLNENILLVAGQEVTLIQDLGDKDDFGRLLRYVLVGEIFVNYQLVQEGHARASAYTPNVACQATFEMAQAIAETNRAGLWRTYATPPPTVLQPTAPEGALVTPLPAPCSCTANTLNCSDFTTQAEAQACHAACIQAGVGDIHQLDGNADGMACESLP
ncbi:MAG: thermonuclease family protein [Anaerolineales bacterium]|nr:thermonuclease family protein [Anaerolineales bacterium]